MSRNHPSAIFLIIAACARSPELSLRLSAYFHLLILQFFFFGEEVHLKALMNGSAARFPTVMHLGSVAPLSLISSGPTHQRASRRSPLGSCLIKGEVFASVASSHLYRKPC